MAVGPQAQRRGLTRLAYSGAIPRPHSFILIALLVVVALASFFFVRTAAGPSGGLAGAQQAARRLTAQDVASVVKRAPDHVGGKGGLRAACRSAGRDELGNPWQCTIRYRDGRQIQYRIRVRVNGSYVGSDPVGIYRGQRFSGTAQISGCCVAVP